MIAANMYRMNIFETSKPSQAILTREEYVSSVQDLDVQNARKKQLWTVSKSSRCIGKGKRFPLSF